MEISKNNNNIVTSKALPYDRPIFASCPHSHHKKLDKWYCSKITHDTDTDRGKCTDPVIHVIRSYFIYIDNRSYMAERDSW